MALDEVAIIIISDPSKWVRKLEACFRFVDGREQIHNNFILVLFLSSHYISTNEKEWVKK